jgi:hypothetical protein
MVGDTTCATRGRMIESGLAFICIAVILVWLILLSADVAILHKNYKYLHDRCNYRYQGDKEKKE